MSRLIEFEDCREEIQSIELDDKDPQPGDAGHTVAVLDSGAQGAGRPEDQESNSTPAVVSPNPRGALS